MRNCSGGKWFACALIGDGIAGLLWPQRYLRSLEVGPRVFQELMEGFAQRPELTRAVSISEIALGSWLLLR